MATPTRRPGNQTPQTSDSRLGPAAPPRSSSYAADSTEYNSDDEKPVPRSTPHRKRDSGHLLRSPQPEGVADVHQLYNTDAARKLEDMEARLQSMHLQAKAGVERLIAAVRTQLYALEAQLATTTGRDLSRQAKDDWEVVCRLTKELNEKLRAYGMPKK
ncbi:Hypothetical predicted protein [Lecanosticta acicola]|uniref:Uncharacterized protein n=1 Tax=Lecanosticta acicola TaxID=111012 RepID=A0AAI9EE09_9PEZI|nr:Hypothetical predicted protein [Lecanosticta acicola]